MLTLDLQLKRGSFEQTIQAQSSAPVIGVFGPSGRGKTTLLHTVAGLIAPQRGLIQLDTGRWFDSNARINWPTQRRRVGLIFQDAQLFPHRTVRGNLTYGYERLPTPERRFTLDGITQQLDLEPLLDRHPLTLSGGEKQRVALGRALLYSPRLLLLDEPLCALDQPRKREILRVLQHIRDQLAIPMLYVSHDRDEILQLTDTIWEL